jgi:hypothetical protein
MLRGKPGRGTPANLRIGPDGANRICRRAFIDSALAKRALRTCDGDKRHWAALSRGATVDKADYEDDLVVCLLRGGFSRVEQTLFDGGRGQSVIQQRMEFQGISCARALKA